MCSSSIEDDFSKQLERKFELASDFQKRQLVDDSVTIYYLNTVVKTDDIQKYIIEPLQQNLSNSYKNTTLKEQIPSIIPALNCKTVSTYKEIENAITNGYTFISFKGKASGILVGTQDWKERGIEEVFGERSLKGPVIGFTEKINSNLNIIRSILKTPELAIETNSYGTLSKTDVSIVYLNGLVDKNVLKKVKERISKLTSNYILESRIVEEAIEGKSTFVDLTMTTERIDTASSAILEGKVIVFVDGNRHAIIAPALFVDFFQSADDFHSKYGKGINRLIRFACFFIAIFLPGLYVTLDKFYSNNFSKRIQEDVFKDDLLPTHVEVLILLILLKVLVDLVSRAPKNMILLLTLIATISIGDASISANFLHPASLVITSLSVLLGYPVAIRGQTSAIFTLRVLYITVGYFTGFQGMMILTTLTIIYFAQLDSVGVPFLSPIIPFRPNEFQDIFFRSSLKKLNNKIHTFPNKKTN